MKPIDFFAKLKAVDRAGTELTLGPSPFRIVVGPSDAMAASLLLWLGDQMPEDATLGDALDVLDSARWWTIFWASQPKTYDDEG